MNPSPHLVAGAALLVGALSAAATEPGPPWGGLDPEARSRALQQKAELPRLPQSDFAWASLGPDRLGGRTTAVAYGGSSGTSFWMGSAGGGLWFSQDFGVNFEQRFVLWPSIGAVAVDPIDSLHVLCGTGDSSGAPDAQPGGGIFASSDGGETWIARGAAALHHVHRIVFGVRGVFTVKNRIGRNEDHLGLVPGASVQDVLRAPHINIPRLLTVLFGIVYATDRGGVDDPVWPGPFKGLHHLCLIAHIQRPKRARWRHF